MKRFALILLLQTACFAQGIVTTVAGTDYIFPDDGKPALQAHLATPFGLTFDRQGNLYFADAGLNMVLKMDTKGVVSIAAGNGLSRLAGDGGSARAASLSTPWGVALDAAGNLYIADSGNGRIRRVDSSGIITTVAGGGSNSPGDGKPATQISLGQPVGVAFDSSGNMLIVERGGSRIRSVNAAGIISTIAGIGQQGFSGDGGAATSAMFAAPEGIAVAPDGTVFIADANNGRVRKFLANGTISTFAGGNTPGTGGLATAAALGQPTAVALDARGNLYIAENSGNRARLVTPQGILTNLAGTGQPGFSGDGGPATQATFAQAFGIAVDAAGNTYISDRLNGRIRRVDSTGTLNTIAGVGAFLGDGGPAMNAVLAGPNESGFGDIAVDFNGNLYIADTANQRVREITPDGQIRTIAGDGDAGAGPNGLPATSTMLHDPAGVAIDPQGNLILADGNSYTISRLTSSGTFVILAKAADVGYTKHVVVDSNGNIYYSSVTNAGAVVKKIAATGAISTYAGTGNTGFSGDGGPATSANLGQVTALAVDLSGNLYIADPTNQRVRRVNPQGIINTIAGTGQPGDSGDGGPATSATLFLNSGLAVDATGNLYLTSADRIRRISPNGTITAWAGSGTFGFSGDGGPAAAVSFNNPSGLALTPQGNLMVWDQANRRIRLVQNGAGPSILVSEKGLTFLAATGGGAPASQSFTIVNGGQGTLTWGVTASTASGGNWLSVSPSSGSSPAGGSGPPIQVSVNATGLTAGDYYGQVQILAAGAPNSPQSVTIVLSVRAPGGGTGSIVQPSGLLFTTATAQSFTLSTQSNSPVTFTGTASFGSATWFTAQPTSGSVVAGKPATVQINPTLTGLAPGVYNANITFAFSDSSIQNVQLLLVISPASSGFLTAHATCAPSKLLPLFTSLGAGFSITTGWPSPVEVRVVDDCANPLTRGAVNTSFSNGDSSLTLTSLGDGRWTGTWQAQAASANVSITASALNSDQSLKGAANVSGGLQLNANPPPVIAPGGVLNSASYTLKGSLAPGSLISVFGTLLSQGSVSAPALPLPTTLGQTTITIAGQKLPLLYASATQANAMIPYNLPINATHQAVVQRGTAISVPEPIGVLSSQSGVFTQDLTGQGQGIIVRVAADATQSVVTTTNPAHVFDAIVIYCDGLGDVTPRQVAGSATPFTPLSSTIDPVTVTVGGIDAPVIFAGLTPGLTGLYQINAYIPVGVAPGDNVPVVITQVGRTSPPVSISVR